MKPIRLILTLFILLFLMDSCRLFKPHRYQEEEYDYWGYDSTEYDNESAESYDKLPLQYAYEIKADIVHTRLDVRFDWNKKYLYGKEWLTMKPHFYPIDSVILDAKEMYINRVELVTASMNIPLTYSYSDSMQLHIKLDKVYTSSESFTLYIDYTARPEERKNSGGSAAITSDKGLYFINPDNSDPDKPRQLWTQGETESNSGWFPTIDKPNMKTTLELSITADSSMKTLSNGLMISSRLNADGTRTDTWKLDKPFAPYLVMMAVGNFAVIKDKWRNIDVNYYTDPQYASYAKRIFGNTPEMLSFYSKKFGYDYPWPKYSQVVVHDFVSGAMENVTATVHYDGLHQTAREMIDENHEDIIAHELSHHWFGDLVTCKSWGQIPLNESFATYSEVLWIQHKYGTYEADRHAEDDLEEYLSEAMVKQMPLIRYRYWDKEDMFDAHSYQKGGYVLRMLHHLVGDEAFTKSLSYYLKTNEYKTVEIDQLRIAFETVTGLDLKWFFDQWFLRPGHPYLYVSPTYHTPDNTVQVSISQSSSLGYSENINYNQPYRLPMSIDIYTASGKQRHEVVFHTTDTTFIFYSKEPPLLVNVDGDKKLLCEIEASKTTPEYRHQYLHTNTYKDKLEAIQYFAHGQYEDTVCMNMLMKACRDKYWGLRLKAVELIEVQDSYKDKLFPLLNDLALRDSSSLVRAKAVWKLGAYDTEAAKNTLREKFKDSSYVVIATSLNTLSYLDNKSAISEAIKLMDEKNNDVSYAICRVFAESKDSAYLPFYAKKMQTMDKNTRFLTLMMYGRYIAEMPSPINLNWLNPLFDAAANEKDWIMRYAAIAALLDVKAQWQGLLNPTDTEAGNKSKVNNNTGQVRVSDIQKQLDYLQDKFRDLQSKEDNTILKNVLSE